MAIARVVCVSPPPQNQTAAVDVEASDLDAVRPGSAGKPQPHTRGAREGGGSRSLGLLKEAVDEVADGLLLRMADVYCPPQCVARWFFLVSILKTLTTVSMSIFSKSLTRVIPRIAFSSF